MDKVKREQCLHILVHGKGKIAELRASIDGEVDITFIVMRTPCARAKENKPLCTVGACKISQCIKDLYLPRCP